jgi:hypothetical protein
MKPALRVRGIIRTEEKTMRKIIDGLAYDTETAEFICEISRQAATLSRTDFGWEDTSLYRTKKGAFFIAGEGGAKSRWNRPVCDGVTGGEGLTLVSVEDAKALVERHTTADRYEATFGKVEEG